MARIANHSYASTAYKLHHYGDLYDRAVKIKDYKEKWCIRLGALHITMAALKCLGKYIESSGLDFAWESSGIYGSATVRQILDRSSCIRMSRSTYNDTTGTYVALSESGVRRI
ncbi:hypothetical protein GQR58_027472 [Nymphon striatum]|nr:hypothetical protein GQR58_027472 [Nymphon striatum]